MTSVTVYTVGAGCPQCLLTKRMLTVAGIEFVDVDLTVEGNAAAREYVTGDLGYTHAPVVVVDDQDHWCGFRPDLIDRLARARQWSDPSPLVAAPLIAGSGVSR